METSTAQPYVGTDVSKAHLDAACLGHKISHRFDNTAEGIAELSTWLRSCASTKIVVEASGGYEQQALIDLSTRGFPVAMINPMRVRHFARSMGLLPRRTGWTPTCWQSTRASWTHRSIECLVRQNGSFPD